MEQNVSQLERVLGTLTRRERVLVSLGFVLFGLALLLCTWSLLVLMAQAGAARSTVWLTAWGLTLGGGGAWMLWIVSRWRRAGSLRHQAACAERVRPELRARLLTVIERLHGAREGESKAILGLAASRARTVMDELMPSEVHPLSSLRSATWIVLGAMSLWVGLLGFASPGPMGLLSWMRVQGTGAVGEEAPTLLDETERALVGDIHLRYTYPEYTGLGSMEVPNSNGLAHGPPGTRVQVQARTDRIYESARLVVLQADPIEIRLQEGRNLEAEFVLTEGGTYRFLLQRQERVIPSVDFPIEIEPDNPPTVEVEAAADRLEVAWDQLIPIAFSARDDFGIERVVVRIRGEKEVLLRAPLEIQSSLQGRLNKTPDELGLSPGDEADLVIEAWDNDAVSGSKPGLSRTMRVVVLGPKASRRRLVRLWRELRDALVDMLAGYATETDPPAKRQNELVVWGGEAASRLDPIDGLIDEYWDAFDVGTLEGVIVEDIRRLGSGMLRFVQAVANPRSADVVRIEDLQTLLELRSELVERAESSVHVLDTLLRASALAEVNKRAEALASAARVLKSRTDLEEVPYHEVQSWLERIERESESMQEAAKDFGKHGISELVARALEHAGRIRDRMVEAVGEEQDERVRELAGFLFDTLNQLALGVDHMQQQAEEAGEDTEDLIRRFIEQLERLQAEERELVVETREAREALGDDLEDLVALWEQALELARKANESADRAAVGTMEDEGFSPMESAQVAEAAGQTNRVLKVVGARDLEGARLEASRSMLRLEASTRTIVRMEQGRAAYGDAPLPTAARQLGYLDVSIRRTAELGWVLNQLDADVNAAPPELRARSQVIAREQEQISNETEEAEGTAVRLAQELPMGAPGLEEGMAGAIREMERSTSALEAGRTVEAEGAEEAAADRLQQALEALQQAAAAMEQMQDAMREGGHGGNRQGGGRASDRGQSFSQSVEIPPPEEFETPEAYRRALLEGMKSDVPPEFEALKRRYYEDLVRQ